MASESKRLLRLAGLCLALIGPVAAQELPGGEAALAPQSSVPQAAQVEFELVEAKLIAAPGSTADSLAGELCQLGPSHVPAMFERLVRAARSRAQEEDPGANLNALQRKALLLALQRMPLAWRSFLRQLENSAADASARSVAVGVIGEIGEALDLQILIDLAGSARPAPRADSEALAPATQVNTDLDEAHCAQFQIAVERVLARDAAGVAQLAGLLLHSDPQLQPLAIRAISNQYSQPGLLALAGLLGRRSELDSRLLSEISRCSGKQTAPFDAAIQIPVRVCLSSSSAEVLREAALASGKLEDSDALALLVGLLAHGNRAVHDNAYWSLKKISGLYLAADPKAWTAWLEQETNWWRERAPAILAQLDSDDLSVALSSVQQIARRRYPRHALAAELCRALDHPQHEVRRLAAVALGALRSRTALPGLLGCLDDEDPQVRSAACRALRSVTGLNLPPERAAWARAGY